MEDKKIKTNKEADESRELKQMSAAEIDAYIKACAEKDKKELDDFIKKQ